MQWATLKSELYHNGEFWLLKLWPSGDSYDNCVDLIVSDIEAEQLQAVGVEVWTQ